MMAPRASIHSTIALSIMCMVLVVQIGRTQEYEIIDNTPFEIDEDGSKAHLVTVRPLTAARFGEVASLPRFRITRQLIADAAEQFGEVQQELVRRGMHSDDVKMSEWTELLGASGYTDKYLFNRSKMKRILTDGEKIAISDHNTNPSFKLWDAITLTNMVATGAIDTHDVEILNLDGSDVELVRFDRAIADKLEKIYSSKDWFEDQSPYEAGYLMAALQTEIREYDSLERSLLEYIGDITFGRPIIYTADEKNLALPNSITKQYDVYWIELRVSFRGLEDDDIQELAFNYALPEGSVALELVPLQVGTEISVETKQVLPGVEVGMEGFRFAVDEAFSKMVAFKYVRPTVIAVGLGEGKFSWLLRGEAVRIGSHKFVVIAGVTKGQTKIDLHMSGHARLGKGLLGGIFDGGAIGGTEVKVVPVAF